MARAKTSRQLKAKEGDNLEFDGISFSLGSVVKRWDNHISARINPSENSELGGAFDLHEWESIRLGKTVLRVSAMTPSGNGNAGEVVFSIERS